MLLSPVVRLIPAGERTDGSRQVAWHSWSAIATRTIHAKREAMTHGPHTGRRTGLSHWRDRPAQSGREVRDEAIARSALGAGRHHRARLDGARRGATRGSQERHRQSRRDGLRSPRRCGGGCRYGDPEPGDWACSSWGVQMFAGISHLSWDTEKEYMKPEVCAGGFIDRCDASSGQITSTWRAGCIKRPAPVPGGREGPQQRLCRRDDSHDHLDLRPGKLHS